MTDYKDTLNLPKTELAMKANLPSKEPKMLEHWEKINLNQKIKEARSGRINLFSMTDPLTQTVRFIQVTQ